MKKLFVLVALCAIGFGLVAQNIPADALYVCKETGSNRGSGTKDKPFKYIQKAIDVAQDGQTIIVSEGRYFGNLDKGDIKVENKAVKIYGGYSKDFSKRDILGTPTLIQPDIASLGTRTGATLSITSNKKVGDVVIDGLIFDHGYKNIYVGKNNTNAAYIEGIGTRIQEQSGAGGFGGENFDESSTAKHTAELHFNMEAESVTIRNCVFVNAEQNGVTGMLKCQNVLVENNVFCNTRYRAFAIDGGYPATQPGKPATGPRTKIEFRYNTCMFMWGRSQDYMNEANGNAFKYANGVDANVHHNIFGCAVRSALDRAWVEGNKADEARKVANADHNIFFLNKMGDIEVVGGGKNMQVYVDGFEDLEQLTGNVEGNKALTDPNVFKGRINEAYLKGFLSLSYGSSSNVDRSSGANQFRSAMGMNLQGTMQSKVSMHANRYPYKESFLLFGAMKGYGAQDLK